MNVSILWDHFRFHGADTKLNDEIHEVFRHIAAIKCFQWNSLASSKDLAIAIKDKSLAFVITRRDQNSPALYTENVMAKFAINKGMPKKNVTSWRTQLAVADKEGRFGFASFPVLTSAILTC